jgi:GNAT superfamily N-acetyltransferase
VAVIAPRGPAGPIELRPTPFTDPVSVRLIAEVQAEYGVRYGGPDEASIDPREFDAPDGMFLVAWQDGEPVGCGGWRRLGADWPGAVEVKRMYVPVRARRRGIASALLAELERTAAAAGATRVLLETGTAQPEAVALYLRSGYEAAPGFGHYAGHPLSLSYGKKLSAPAGAPVPGGKGQNGRVGAPGGH